MVTIPEQDKSQSPSNNEEESESMTNSEEKKEESKNVAPDIEFGTQVAEVAKIKIVAMSTEINEEIKEKCSNLGFIQVLKKPVT